MSLFRVFALSQARPAPIVFYVEGVSQEAVAPIVARRLRKITKGLPVFDVRLDLAREEEERVRDLVREALERAQYDSRGAGGGSRRKR